MIFSTKVLLSKTNVMQEKSVRQKKRQNSGMLRGLGCFLGIKWAVAVPIFTLFNFFPLQTYFYAKSHLLSMLKLKKSDRWRKKSDQSTPALMILKAFVSFSRSFTNLWVPRFNCYNFQHTRWDSTPARTLKKIALVFSLTSCAKRCAHYSAWTGKSSNRKQPRKGVIHTER